MNSGPEISIIIPTLNEEAGIGSLLDWLTTNASSTISKEIIIVDGGSTDQTIQIAENYPVLALRCNKGRAKQMNHGAIHASGKILYFLHADTFPPKKFDITIQNAYKKGSKAGCFRMRFDTTNPILQFFAWLTRFNLLICRGGDQSLFITKTLFNQLNGYDERYTIYEDSEFIKRIYQQARFKVLPSYVTTSSRRYKETGWLQTQYYFGVIHLKNRLGVPPQELYGYYQRKFGA
ncbi:TIGR04283 family arsenosugar biosynthesis glycosyltransferase [Croceivirga sp. JEA036]|uniref:TIGR04283 family arsenosugar biosynthesis glycosyltransferase n=1 Tax=Croceivirga sp. JEA036 TaxID=2721162 RepID=UPI00143BCAD1|nr:TIGR04283 family arsenosugar biosynthesis glycosyltransferase [Croceivirga sp. JEA036]NJB36695.1 glycosyltransferase [Croceivirga sp. JEA036]